MRLVRRVFAGAAASLALGALFTGMALGAEPTADADATANLDLGGLGTDGDLGIDAALDTLLGGTGDVAAATDGVVSVDIGADPSAGSTVDVTVGAVTAPDVAEDATLVADADVEVALDATETTFAVDGRRGGSVFNVDLGAASDGSTGTIENVAADLAIGAGTDTGDASGDAAADLAIGAGTGGSDASASLGISAVMDAVPTALGIVDGAVAGLGLDAVTDATDALGGPGTGATTDVVATSLDVVRGAVLGIQTTAAALASGDDAPTDGDVPTGRDGGMAAPAGPGGTSLPDTAFGVGTEVALWGLLLVVLAGMMASARSLPSRRRR